MISGLKRHALVVLVAVLVATYQLYRLESQRARRSSDVEDEFERATRFLQGQLAAHANGGGRYEVRVTFAAHSKQHKSALVINRQYEVPRIEAELFVDPRLVAKRKQQRSLAKQRTARPNAAHGRADPPPSALRLRIYDHASMDAVAKTLQQHKLIESYDTS